MQKKPSWIKTSLQATHKFDKVIKTLKGLELHTVCVEAKCPNLNECWDEGTATFLILGDVCTRNCKFCATKTGNPKGYIDFEEPERVLSAVKEMKLDYVVITSVTRDDLSDQGASIFAETVKLIKDYSPHVLVETLVPDLNAERSLIELILNAGVDVFAHNVEVVERLTPLIRDKRANYHKSLLTLKTAKELERKIFIKSGFMIGLGETKEEIIKTMEDLLSAGVDILTIGQYLRPSLKHAEVEKYYTPEEFNEFARIGREMGFKLVASGPLVRSSYRAGEFYVKMTKNKNKFESVN
ncbi:MAG: lipoyl synthase [Candidatus Hydrothermia bacterium]|jgi:lipoic acid synthetase